MQILRDRPDNFLVVSGDDALALPQIACGMDGVISVAANSLPGDFSEMVRLCLAGNFKGGKQINDKLIEAYELMFTENNPAGVKAFLTELKLIDNYLRLPLVPLSEGIHTRVRAFLENNKHEICIIAASCNRSALRYCCTIQVGYPHQFITLKA
jgi:4-hydroxy-tetrahydrodipicolinate synthase